MKKRFFAVAMLLCALTLSAFAQNDPRKGFSEYKLDNGLTIMLWEDQNLPDVHGRVVCRAGAMTLAEIACMGKAAVIIPSPNVTNNHQYKNAKVLADDVMAAFDKLNETK